MKDKICTSIELYLDNVTLSLSVRESLKKEKGSLKNFGYIKVHDGSLDSKEVFWDNINYFLRADKKEFKKECKEDLDKADYNWKETYKTIKKLLKRAEKLNLITIG